MAQIIEITDLDRPGLDVYARLTEAQLRRPDTGIFIAESVPVIEHALDAGCAPISFLLTSRHARGKARALLERCQDVPAYTCDESLLARLTGYALTRGVLAAFIRPLLPHLTDVLPSARRLAVLENITDSTNVGAIFRSAAALGADAIVLSPSCCDPLCRRSVRVSMGTIFQVPWTYASGSWPDDLFAHLRQYGFNTAALALRERSVELDDPALTASDKLAIFLGTEGSGLSDSVLEACDSIVTIPMTNGVDSLNVAAAAAVAFWQLRVKKS